DGPSALMTAVRAAHGLLDRVAVSQLASDDAESLVREIQLGGRTDVGRDLVAAAQGLLDGEAPERHPRRRRSRGAVGQKAPGCSSWKIIEHPKRFRAVYLLHGFYQ